MKPQILLILSLASSALAAPPLLPFQGHLTQSNGEAVEDGAKVVQFKIYDAPVSGNAVWAGEVHKLSVNKGLVNTILGTKTALAEVDFAETLYLEMTVDANSDDTITAGDPPLLPRQVILPAVFAQTAGDSRMLQGMALLKVDGTLKPEFFAEKSIPASAIVDDNRITKEQLGVNSVEANELADGSVDTAAIQNLAVNGDKLANGVVSNKHLTPDFEARLAAMEQRLSNIESGRWNSIPPIDFGEMPFTTNTPLTRTLPQEIPIGAREVLLFCFSHQGRASATRTPKIKISTSENGKRFEKYFQFRTYASQDDLSSQTENIWLPITNDRIITMTNVGNTVPRGNVSAPVQIVGYR